ncbi:transposase [Embleya sp. NPDC020886]|uniref:IS110 family transposase n=1 Tax=Embleya sp. NPDC020886 TaxID=3363980 RepID=UPI00379808CB
MCRPSTRAPYRRSTSPTAWPPCRQRAAQPWPAAALHPRPRGQSASAGYRGTGKTDAKDAIVIADQARTRRDPTVSRPDDAHAVELRILTNRRANPTADRTRRINRLCSRLTEKFPALERALDPGNVGPLPLAARHAGRAGHHPARTTGTEDDPDFHHRVPHHVRNLPCRRQHPIRQPVRPSHRIPRTCRRASNRRSPCSS